jgi:hypothetical protein
MPDGLHGGDEDTTVVCNSSAVVARWPTIHFSSPKFSALQRFQRLPYLYNVTSPETWPQSAPL